MFEKFSILWVVLPYLGHWEKWERLLKTLSKRSAGTWAKYQSAFRNLFIMTEWDWSEVLQQLLVSWGIDKTPVVNEHYQFEMNLFKTPQPLVDFWAKSQGLWFKPIMKLKLCWLYKLGEMSLRNTNRFLASSFRSLKVLHLEGCNKMDLARLGPGLVSLLPRIQEHVYLRSFKIDEASLQSIVLVNITCCKTLTLRYWFIDEISDKFAMSSDTEFQLETLNLFMTARKDSQKW